MDAITYAAAKKYTDDSIKDAGAIKGQDGLTPYIKDGNWWIGNEDTGIKAAGDNYVLTDADKTEIAKQAAGLIDITLADAIGTGVIE